MDRQRIVVVTDSSAYIPKEAQRELSIPVIPLWITWGQDHLRDGVDITTSVFYRRLRESDVLPTTSQPSAGEFEAFFRQLGSRFDAIVGVFVTSELSGTVASAQLAQTQLPELPIRIVDSRSVSMGLGFAALAAARAADAGKPLDEVMAAAEEMRERVHLLFVVDTLEYLYRGGRIGGAKWLMGAALNIKPLLHFKDGTIEPLAQVRTKRRAIARLLEVAEQRLGGGAMAEAAVVDAGSPEEGDALADQVRERFGMESIYRTTVSPAIGVHAGPGVLGLAFYAED